ncbi:MAG TPA: 4-(cytidine 5'-diphospho)-2-C-methyl-D-erythritol kinase [Dyella sp.]|nr:4-(cytidine 5'-diphospho)-2-C-methyl-D-erythritol kinase [Dyella sp.]
MSFRIERAATTHVEALCAIERAAVETFRGHPAWRFYSSVSIPPEQLAEEIQRGFVWVALDNESAEPVGFVWLDAEQDGHIIGIAEIDVLPAFHRRGIGTALLEHACAWARAAGYRRVDLGTLADVPWNAPFYARHGFAIVDKNDPAYAYARERDREHGFPDTLRVFMSRALSPPRASEWAVWPAPVKLNLFLRMLERRDDGQQAWQTVFRLLDWCNEIRVRVRDDGGIHCATDAQDGSGDLLMRAAALLRDRANVRCGADIDIQTRVPAIEGLGGRHSNAASAMIALNRLWQCGLTVDEVADLASELDAEIALFVRGRSAWVTGAGEYSRPIKLPRRWYVVLDPHEHVSVDDLFQTTELTRIASPATISSFASGETLENVFEPFVRARYPRVAAALDWLADHGHARLSGAGGCVFMETPTPERAEAIARHCPRSFAAYVVEGVGLSSLHRALARHAAAA